MASKVRRASINREECLPHELHIVPEELRKRARSELFEDEDTRKHSLKLLRSMLKGEPDLHCQDDEQFLLGFLRARKFDVKRAFNLIKTFYHITRKHEELYSNFNFADVRETMQENSIGFLPYRCSEGCSIFVLRIHAWKPHDNPLSDIIRALTCVLLQANLYTASQIAGYKAIVDLNGFTLKHLPHVSPGYLWLFAEALQNCFPARFRAVHIVNENYVFSYIWTILKPFLSTKLKQRFHFHGKNVSKLHKYFSPSILLPEFKGELPPFDNSKLCKVMEEQSDYLTHVFSHGYQKQKTKKCDS